MTLPTTSAPTIDELRTRFAEGETSLRALFQSVSSFKSASEQLVARDVEMRDASNRLSVLAPELSSAIASLSSVSAQLGQTIGALERTRPELVLTEVEGVKASIAEVVRTETLQHQMLQEAGRTAAELAARLDGVIDAINQAQNEVNTRLDHLDRRTAALATADQVKSLISEVASATQMGRRNFLTILVVGGLVILLQVALLLRP
jgi:chromosome segregation ATPase